MAGGIGRLMLAVVAFALVAPVALIALPAAALLIASRPNRIREWAAAGAAAGIALAWLLVPGDLPDQVLRAASVIATAIFAPLTLRTGLTFIHRALAAVGATGVALFGLVPLTGTSWSSIHWWVEHQTGMAARSIVGTLWSAGAWGVETHPTIAQIEQGVEQLVVVLADFYPALLALQVTAGLALAIAIYGRIAAHPLGRPLGRFADFRFSEHLGWAAALPLITILIPALAASKAAASNVLFVTGALFALRGAAVAAFGLGVVGVGGAVTWLLVAVGVFLLLPVAIGGAIVLGVIDARVDLRRRWQSSPS